MKTLLTVLTASLLISSPALAWGERGHHVICGVATKLVKNPKLKKFLVARRETMGHMCNLPDISWKSQGTVAAPGDAAHFIDPENLGLTVRTVPTSFTDIYAHYEGKYSEKLGRNIDVAKDLGSVWWRTEQFYNTAIEHGKRAVEESKNPNNTAPKRDPNKTLSLEDLDPATQGMYNMMLNMGVMGHFVGDASQPLHVTANYDGWENGHGGLHSFYETAVVNEMSEFLPAEVYAAARMLNFQFDARPVVAMKQLSNFADSQRPLLFAVDRVLVPSRLEKGMKIPAQRQDAKKVTHQFAPLIVAEMAASAKLLAQMWDGIYQSAGEVPVDKYKSYLYPLDSKFVPLNYLSGSNLSSENAESVE